MPLGLRPCHLREADYGERQRTRDRQERYLEGIGQKGQDTIFRQCCDRGSGPCCYPIRAEETSGLPETRSIPHGHVWGLLWGHTLSQGVTAFWAHRKRSTLQARDAR